MSDQEKLVREIFDVPEKKQRTNLENASLHCGCDKLAKALNAAGFDRKQALEALPKEIEAPNTMESVKVLYRLIMHAMFGYTSTKQLSTTEITEVWDKLNIILGETLDPEIMVKWPCQEETKAFINSFKKQQ